MQRPDAWLLAHLCLQPVGPACWSDACHARLGQSKPWPNVPIGLTAVLQAQDDAELLLRPLVDRYDSTVSDVDEPC